MAIYKCTLKILWVQNIADDRGTRDIYYHYDWCINFVKRLFEVHTSVGFIVTLLAVSVLTSLLLKRSTSYSWSSYIGGEGTYLAEIFQYDVMLWIFNLLGGGNFKIHNMTMGPRLSFDDMILMTIQSKPVLKLVNLYIVPSGIQTCELKTIWRTWKRDYYSLKKLATKTHCFYMINILFIIYMYYFYKINCIWYLYIYYSYNVS